MAKGRKSVKRTDVQGPQGKGVSFEHSESFDDNLLPDAVELERLQKMDPDIMQWVKESTTKEQEARHKFSSRKIGLFESAQDKAFKMDKLQILSALIVILSGMGLSTLLILKDQLLIGTIFGGGTIIFAANAFLKFGKHRPKVDNNN